MSWRAWTLWYDTQKRSCPYRKHIFFFGDGSDADGGARALPKQLGYRQGEELLQHSASVGALCGVSAELGQQGAGFLAVSEGGGVAPHPEHAAQ